MSEPMTTTQTTTTDAATDATMTDAPWRDRSLTATERAGALIAELTLEEKIAQLYGIWIGASDDGADVAPHQHLSLIHI